jgi:hypothetical protein
MNIFVIQSVNNTDAQRILRMGSGTAQAVSPRPSAAEASLQSHVSSSGTCGREVAQQQRLSPST